MKIEIRNSSITDIKLLRNQFLNESQFQIRYEACHVRGWADEYLISIDGMDIGYASVKGLKELSDRDTVFEYFILPAFREKSNLIFEQVLEKTKSTYLECQTNDFLMTSMLYEFGVEIRSEVMLFKDEHETSIENPDMLFRKKKPSDDLSWKHPGEAGQYILEKNEMIVADGGFLTHYNEPFADLYMEVRPDQRGQGLAGYILQEIKKECYKAERVPAARCNISNHASRGALLKAGMRVCGYMLEGKVR